MDKRCLVISYYFPPVGGGGVQRMVKMMKYLKPHGWHFTVLTAQNDIVSQPEDTTILDEIKHAVKVRYVSLNNKTGHINAILKKILPNKSGFLQRWLSAFLYIPDIRMPWLGPLHEVVIEELTQTGYDCILVTSPPYSLAIYAAKLTREVPLPVILDMRDPWTTNPYKIYPTPYHYRKDYSLEMASISRIEFGISAYESLIDFYAGQIQNFNKQNWTTIPNGYDESDFSRLKNASLANNCFNIAFSGTFYSHINNPEPLFKAIHKLEPDFRRKIKFHHIGTSQIDLYKLALKYNIESNIILWGYLSHKECIEQLNKMDALCFILDDKNKKSKNTVGGKVYEYLRLKKPVLALVPVDGEAADLIKKTRSGVAISPRNTVDIYGTLKNWITTSPEFDYTDIEKYSRESQARKFMEVFDRACKIYASNN